MYRLLCSFLFALPQKTRIASMPYPSACVFVLLFCFRSELTLLRSQKPMMGEQREAVSVPAADAMTQDSPVTTKLPSLLDASTRSGEDPEPGTGDSTTETSSGTEACTSDEDSNEAVGMEEAAELDQDLMDADADVAQEEIAVEVEPITVTTMFRKILALGSSTGQVEIKTHQDDSALITPSAPLVGPSASLPTLVQNGRMVSSIIPV